MGGRGSASSRGGGTSGGITGGNMVGGGGGPLFNAQQNIANQAPSPSNTPVVPNAVSALSQMSDSQLAALYNASRNVDMPNHLSDIDDATQKFVYTAGINEKPTVLDDASFNQYLAANNIPTSQILSRSTGGADYVVNGTRIHMSADQVSQLMKDGEMTYVGGKYGGMVHGAGTYFDRNGGGPTGYAGGRNSVTMIGVLKPNARVINESSLSASVGSFRASHPQFARAVGPYTHRTMSIYALAMGYQVIQYGSYHNVIDRSATVMRQSNW